MKSKTYTLKYLLVCSLCKKTIAYVNKKVEATSCVKCSKKGFNKIHIHDLYGK